MQISINLFRKGSFTGPFSFYQKTPFFIKKTSFLTLFLLFLSFLGDF